MDCRSLRPGQNWDFEIKRALDKATFVLFFLSNNSFDRRGYIQRELKLALDKANEKLVDDIYLIPILLDDNVPIPDLLKGVQHISAASADCNERIVDALNHQLGRLGSERIAAQEEGGITWRKRKISESWDGLPGYEVELEYFEFQSNEYANISQISDYIKGRLLSSLFDHRAAKLSLDPRSFNYGQTRFLRTDSYDAHCSEPTIIGKVMSIQYTVDWYGAGAAHPNHHFETYNFLLDPLVLIKELSDMFKDVDEAFRVIQEHARSQLYEVRVGDDPEDEENKLPRHLIDDGTSKWEHFQSFKFSKDNLDLLFAPYQVAAYACGPQFASLPFSVLAPFMRPEFVSAMYLDMLIRR